jgi:sodium/bile acid cotransporter 7
VNQNSEFEARVRRTYANRSAPVAGGKGSPAALLAIGVVGTVLLASVAPARGGFAAVVGWLSLTTIVLLFFFHGARLARDQVLAGLAHWRLHLTILGCTFVLFPVAGVLGERLLPHLLQRDLWVGMLFVCALPSTVQSAIAFVSMARGNVPAAVASASASVALGAERPSMFIV